MVTEDTAPGQAQQEMAAKAGRIQSEIEFPYSDLETAVDLARALHTNAGSSCEDAELAAWLDQSVNGGTYRARRSGARMFGLIEIAQGRLSLTPLGHRVVELTEGRAARADAFLLSRALWAYVSAIWRAGVAPRRQRSSATSNSSASHLSRKVARGRSFRNQRNMLATLIPAAGASSTEMNKSQERERRSSGGGGDGGGQADIDPTLSKAYSRGCRNPEMQGRQPVTPAGGSGMRCPRAKGSSPLHSGGIGHHVRRHYDRRARCSL